MWRSWVWLILAASACTFDYAALKGKPVDGGAGDSPRAADVAVLDSRADKVSTDVDAQETPTCAQNPAATRACYDGPSGTMGVGRCRAGIQACGPNGDWASTCVGEVLPAGTEICGNGIDDDCHGGIDDGCDPCAGTATRACYSGPAGTAGQGLCRVGTQTCTSGTWDPVCAGEVLPAAEICNGLDDDCNKVVDDPIPAAAACPASTVAHAIPTCLQGTCGIICGAGFALRAGACPKAVRLDVNGDGFSDVVAGMVTTNGMAVYLGSATGLATTPAAMINTRRIFYALGDVNGDGFADVAAGDMSSGRVFVFLGSAQGLATTSSATLESNGSFGSSLAGVGDLTGDGFPDVLVGNNDSSFLRATLFPGGPTGLHNYQYSVSSGTAGFGTLVAAAGDVNGDGLPDILVGGPKEVNLYLGTLPPFGTPPTVFQTPDKQTTAATGVGDVNQDGFDDVVASEASSSNGTGFAYLYYGNKSGLSGSAASTLVGPDGGNGLFGSTVVPAGDVNGDGIPDVAIGAPGAVSGTGRVYVYLGGRGGLSSTPIVLTGPDGAGGSFGAAISGGGDINGDGFADLVVAAPNAVTKHGRIYIYYGSATGLAPTPDLVLDAPVPGTMGIDLLFGYTLA